MSGYEAWRRTLSSLAASSLTRSIEEDENGNLVESTPAVDAAQIEAIAMIYHALMKLDEKNRRNR